MPKAANPSTLKDEFEDLGYDLSDGPVIDGLCALCDIYGLSEERLSCLYLTHSSETPSSKDELTSFENQILVPLKNSAGTKSKNRVLHDANSLKKLQARHEDNDDDDDLIASSYGQTSRKDKVHSTPEKPSIITEVSSPFCTRSNAGETLTRFGILPKGPPKSTLIDIGPPSVLNPLSRPYSFMFERLRETAGILDEILCRQADVLLEKYPSDLEGAMEGDISVVNTEPFNSFGRICCEESEGKMNARSMVLQGSMDASGGRTVPLDIKNLKEYSLFPGQIVGLKGTNPHGGKLVADKIIVDGSGTRPGVKGSKKYRRDFSLLVSSGPFTTKDDLTYAPLKELLKQIRNAKPEYIVLCGPFLDERHPILSGKENGGDPEESYESIFALRVMKPLSDALHESPNTRAILVPSFRDLHHHPIYPTPPFDSSLNNDRIHMLSDPSLFTLEGVLFGVTSVDVLFHLTKSAISGGGNDRLKGLARHLLQQRSFYPLYPFNSEMSVDAEKWETFCRLDSHPDVLILPSDLMHFIKDVDGTLVINPSRLSRGSGGGVYAKINICGSQEDKDVLKGASAAILRI